MGRQWLRRDVCLRLAASVAVGLACGRAGAAGPDASVALVQEGGPKAVVIVPYENPVAQSGAASGAMELSEYLEKMTSRAIPVVAEGKGLYVFQDRRVSLVAFAKDRAVPQGTPEIHVGWTTAAREAVDRKRLDALDMDGYLIRSTPDRVFIVGKNEWGTYYGCLHVLETYCGVRWYMPGEIGEDVLRQATVRMPLLDQTFEPAFKHRELSRVYSWKSSGTDDYPADSAYTKTHSVEGLQWSRRARLRQRLFYHHNLRNVFAPAKYGTLYPDLYPMFKGRTERYIPTPEAHDWQPCLTCPKAVDLAMDFAREFFAKDPAAGSISLAPNDAGPESDCCCERCMKLIDTNLPANEQRSVLYFTFLNAVAERFDTEFPDKRIGHLLYGGASRYPKNMKVHPRLVTFLVRQSYRKYLPEQWKGAEEEMALVGWSAAEFGIYDWLHGGGYQTPRPQPHHFDSYIKEVYAKGGRHYKGEAYSNWSLDGFRYWVITRLLWDPRQNVDDLLNDFFTRFFRESAAPMRAYYDTCEEYLASSIRRDLAANPDENAIVMRYFRQGSQNLEPFPPEAIAKCDKALADATQQARSQIVLDRVEFFRKGIGVGRIMATEYHTVKKVLELCGKPETRAEALALYAGILKPELDVQLYYDTVILPDPTGPRPGGSMFDARPVATAAIIGPIRDRVMELIQTANRWPAGVEQVDSAVQQAMREAISSVKDPTDRDLLRVALGEAAGKIVLCNPVPKPPVVDGDLSDACWTTSPAYSDFTWSTRRPLKYGTSFQIVRNGNRLFVAVRCARKPGAVIARTSMRDQSTWRDDSIDFLLNKLADTGEAQRFQAAIDAKGNFFDFYDGKVEWNGDLQVATKIEAETYSMEFSVPLDQIGIDPVTMPFIRCNVIRIDASGAGLRSGTTKSYWAPAVRAFPDPLSRGLLLFNRDK